MSGCRAQGHSFALGRFLLPDPQLVASWVCVCFLALPGASGGQFGPQSVFGGSFGFFKSIVSFYRPLDLYIAFSLPSLPN